jgi:hypothetical protein
MWQLPQPGVVDNQRVKTCAHKYFNSVKMQIVLIFRPTYFVIKSKMHGKVMDVSNDPKTYGTINMWDQLNVGIQQWFLDDNGVIRAKATGYCIYSKGDL